MVPRNFLPPYSSVRCLGRGALNRKIWYSTTLHVGATQKCLLNLILGDSVLCGVWVRLVGSETQRVSFILPASLPSSALSGTASPSRLGTRICQVFRSSSRPYPEESHDLAPLSSPCTVFCLYSRPFLFSQLSRYIF